MTTLLQPTPTTNPTRLTLRTCVTCGAVSEPGECADGCHESLLDLAPAADCDRLAGICRRAHSTAEAFRTVAAGLTGPEPSALECEAAYDAVRQRARAVLRRFPPTASNGEALPVSVTAEPAWWCPDCDGVEAPQPCLEMCIWMPVDWVDAAVYRRERERALAQQAIESDWRALLRRLASVTPRAGQAVRCWRAFGAEARALLKAGDRDVVDGEIADGDGGDREYERGVWDGREWADGYATAAELRQLAGDLSGEGDPHWGGFVAGAEELLAEHEAALSVVGGAPAG